MTTETTMVTARSHGFLLAALILVVAAGMGMKWQDVQCGDVLDVDHGQYRLTGDLVCPFTLGSGFAAVHITGEGVHFNLDGYMITRDDDSGVFLRMGIAVSGANAHINNGSIVDINCPFANDPNCSAIRLFEAPGARINGMSLHNNNTGIAALSDANADGARIHGNDITRNLSSGIGFFGTADGARITDNDLSDTYGLVPDFGNGYIGTSDDVSLIGNVANNCTAAGILLFGDEAFPPAQRNTVRDNTTLDNGRAGIGAVGATEATRPRDNLIQSNTSFGNNLGVSLADLNEAVVGVGTAADCLNTWKDNDFGVALLDCIE
jgi:hypothetical protein